MSYDKDEPISYEVLELAVAVPRPTDSERLARATHSAVSRGMLVVEDDDKLYWDVAIPGWVLIPSAQRLAELGYVHSEPTFDVGYTYKEDDDGKS